MSSSANRIVRNTGSCPKRWDDLKGDEFVRDCATCSHKVYNLTGLTPAEVLAFVEQSEGKVCALIHCDNEGYVVNGECERAHDYLGTVDVVKRTKAQKIAARIAATENQVRALQRLAALISRDSSEKT
jgi:hypothetical protein